jgi:hypothetical protein
MNWIDELLVKFELPITINLTLERLIMAQTKSEKLRRFFKKVSLLFIMSVFPLAAIADCYKYSWDFLARPGLYFSPGEACGHAADLRFVFNPVFESMIPTEWSDPTRLKGVIQYDCTYTLTGPGGSFLETYFIRRFHKPVDNSGNWTAGLPLVTSSSSCNCDLCNGIGNPILSTSGQKYERSIRGLTLKELILPATIMKDQLRQSPLATHGLLPLNIVFGKVAMGTLCFLKVV